MTRPSLSKLRTKGAWETWSVVPRMWPWVRPHKLLAFASALLTGLAVVIGLAQPWPLAFMVDSVLGNQPPPAAITNLLGTSDKYALLVFAAVASLVLAIITNGIAVVHEYVNTKLEQRLVLDFRSDLFWHAQRLSVDYHDRKQTGQLMTQLLQEADAAGSIVMELLPLAQSVLTLVGMFVIVLRMDAELALLSLIVVPFVYYSVGFYSTRIVPLLRHVRGLEWQSASIIFESMSMLRVVAAFAREPYEFSRFRTQGETAANARVGLTVRQTLFSLGVNTATAAGTALILAVGALNVLHGQLTVGELLVVLSYIASVYQPLETISSTVGSMQQQFVAVQGAFMLLDTDPEINDVPGAVEVERARGAIAFDRVSFSYHERDDTLRDITFAVEPGQHIGIVGPTGAGKTTLANLIKRFHDPDDGHVELDGVDVRKLKLRSLREQISVVLQVPQLFSGTIADNIRYGRLDATQDEIVGAAKAANAHSFIEHLPEGYATELSEGGAQISVGERQRICVARAFLKDAPILILDEPTSSIDSKTEGVILDALDQLMVGRTTFMIAHRLSTIRHADVILVLSHGRLVERGTHEELLEVGGLYRELYDAQTVRRRTRGPRQPTLLDAARPRSEVNGGVDPPEVSHGATRPPPSLGSAPVDLPASAAWLLLVAARELADSGTPAALEALSHLHSHPTQEVRLAAKLAESLLAGLEGQKTRPIAAVPADAQIGESVVDVARVLGGSR
jgi:ATP-binding cassette subfamily B protein